MNAVFDIEYVKLQYKCKHIEINSVDLYINNGPIKKGKMLHDMQHINVKFVLRH